MLRNFRLQVLGRILLLTGMLGGGLYLGLVHGMYVAAGLLGLLAGATIWNLFRTVDQTNRELARFLRSVRYGDFTQTFSPRGRGESFEELAGAFDEVMDDFRAARAEKEEQARYLETIVSLVGVGVLAFDETGEVSLINREAKKLLDRPKLNHLEELEPENPGVYDRLRELPTRERDLVTIRRNGEERQISIYGTMFKLGQDRYKLVSLQDIHTELEAREIEAWQKLTRVLTHEMMNSITPIASLAETIRDLVGENGQAGASPSDSDSERGAAEDPAEDVRGAAETIARRSQHLLNFVEQYRKLTRVPEPDRDTFEVRELFEEVERLAAPRLEESGIRFSWDVEPETMKIVADPEQVEQILINLVKNAIEATEGRENPTVRLEGRIDRRSKALIRVIDTGSGISPEAREKIFVPFFTTKEQGSGIGLALSKQIVRKHGGSLVLDSEPEDEETVFALRF